MSLQGRILIAVGYVLLVAVAAFVVPLAINFSDRTESEVRLQAASQADLLAVAAGEELTEGRDHLQALAEAGAEAVRGRVLITDRGGGVLADSGGAATGDRYDSRPEVNSALAGRKVQFERASATLDTELLATAAPIVSGESVAGAVRVTQSVEAVDSAVGRSLGGLALIALFVIAIGLGAGVVVSRQIAQPLRDLNESVERISGGDLGERAPVAGSTEQRALATSFNEMTVRLGRVLESQRQFVADASHQLRTPLTGLRLRLEEADAATGDAAVKRELAAGVSDLDRLSNVVEELLVLSSIGEREARSDRVPLEQFAAAAVRRWDTEAEHSGVRLELQANGTGEAFAPPADVERILDVLVENALRYGAGGGEVEVVIADSRVEVRDRGPGFARGEEAEVFERFHRGSAARSGAPGTGLGLPIARALAQSWGGDVTVANRSGGGAVATIHFRSAPPPRGSR